MRKYKVLIIYDTHVDTPSGRLMWAYGRRAEALQKYAPDDMDIDICQTVDTPWTTLNKYDLIFNLEYMAPSRRRIKAHAPNAVLVVSYNSDSNRRRERWSLPYVESDWLIVNNQEMFEFKNRSPHTCCISNGIDTEVFRPTVPIENREHRILWYGSSSISKGKGWQEFIQPAQPLLEELGFICDFKPIDNIDEQNVLPLDKIVEKYNSCSYVMCASRADATPNFVSESVSCGCVAVSVPIGNILEWGKHGENCVLAEWSVQSFIDCFKYAKANRERIAKAGMETLHSGWSYGEPGNRAQYFYQLWRRLLTDGPQSIKPFSCNEIHWSDI